MYYKILVPLDGSELAEQILPHSITLAQHYNSVIHLVQVIPLASQLAAMGLGSAGVGGIELGAGSIPDARILESEVSKARTYLEKTGTALKGQEIEAVWEVRRGIPAEEINNSANKNNVDLITICTHGRSGIGRLVFGSVADRVMRESGKPVLLIKSAKMDI
jgi:nucleotide-binding universal stress UspA family protein